MSKHPRSEEELVDAPLHNSIKKLRIDGNACDESTTGPHLPDPQSGGRTPTSLGYESQLKSMNNLLGYLHSLRLGRKMEKHQAQQQTSTPSSTQSSEGV
jgi:hypothetical protein